MALISCGRSTSAPSVGECECCDSYCDSYYSGGNDDYSWAHPHRKASQRMWAAHVSLGARAEYNRTLNVGGGLQRTTVRTVGRHQQQASSSGHIGSDAAQQQLLLLRCRLRAAASAASAAASAASSAAARPAVAPTRAACVHAA